MAQRDTRHQRVVRGAPSNDRASSASWAMERLAEVGEKQHGKREAIARAFFDGDVESTAHELWALLRDRGQALGLSTVRRTLETLVRHGLARRKQRTRGESSFGPIRWHVGHGRVICTSCRRTDFFGDERVEELHRAIGERLGYTVRGHTLDLYGVCERCRSEGSAPRRESGESDGGSGVDGVTSDDDPPRGARGGRGASRRACRR